ncbi:flippase [Candidatus Woesearchaeota archaeon]|nr:flippase [Candidatus Woesearchaeota archaeon]
MSEVRKIAKNTLFLTAGDIITKVLLFILAIYIARFLGPSEFGKFSFAFAFTFIFSILADLGLSVLVVREIAKNKDIAQKYLNNVLWIKIFSSIIIYALILITINLMKYPSDIKLAVYIVGLSVIINSFAEIFRSTFRAFEEMQYDALTNIIGKTTLFIIALYILFNGFGLIILCSVYLIESIINLLISTIFLKTKIIKFRFKFDLSIWKNLLKLSLPLGLSFVLFYIYSKIDTVMLSYMIGDSVVGWYNASYQLIDALLFIPIIFGTVLFPAMSRFTQSSIASLRVLYKKSFKYLIMLSIPIAVGTTLLAQRFILFIYKQQFAESVLALQILIWSIIFMFILRPTNYVLMSINKQNTLVINASITVIINILLNLLLIPEYAHHGAAIATVISEFVVISLSYYFVSKYFYRIKLFKMLFKISLSSFIMGLFIHYAFELHLIPLVLIAASIYFISLLLLRTFDKKDLNILLQILGKA